MSSAVIKLMSGILYRTANELPLKKALPWSANDMAHICPPFTNVYPLLASPEINTELSRLSTFLGRIFDQRSCNPLSFLINNYRTVFLRKRFSLHNSHSNKNANTNRNSSISITVNGRKSPNRRYLNAPSRRSFSTSTNPSLLPHSNAISRIWLFFLKMRPIHIAAGFGVGFATSYWWVINSGNSEHGKDTLKKAEEYEQKQQWQQAIPRYFHAIEAGLGQRLRYQAFSRIFNCLRHLKRTEFYGDKYLRGIDTDVHLALLSPINNPLHPYVDQIRSLIYENQYYMHRSTPEFMKDAKKAFDRLSAVQAFTLASDPNFNNLLDNINKRNQKIEVIKASGHGIAPTECKIVSPAEFASLSAQVYHNGEFISKNEKWQCIYKSNSNQNVEGYYGEIYVNHDKKHIAVVHRGTIPPSLTSWITNLKFYIETPDDQFAAAKRTTEVALDKLKTFEGAYKVTQTGHSQGAFLAEYEAFRNNQYAVTFESPGSVPIIIAAIKAGKFGKITKEHFKLRRKKITEFLAEPNPVNCLRPHIGKRRYHLIIPNSAPQPVAAKSSYFERFTLFLFRTGIRKLKIDGLIDDVNMNLDLLTERVAYHSISRIAEYLKKDLFEGERVPFYHPHAWPHGLAELHTLAKEEKKENPGNFIREIYHADEIDRTNLPLKRINPKIVERLLSFYDTYHLEAEENSKPEIAGLNKNVLDHCYLNGIYNLIVQGGWTADELEQYITRHAKV